ncbi:MAG: hypothetical protein GC180_01590 [Bacteroidetes bacterium]|nr:hypothetical protein [Bacteroidota bacterium]
MGAKNVRHTALALLLIMGSVSCDKQRKCENAVCTSDQDLQIVLVDSVNNNLIEAGTYREDQISLISQTKDTISGTLSLDKGSFIVQTNRDMSQYTLAVENGANVDLLVFQNYVPTQYDCCPGYWRIDSVYARGSRLQEAPDGQSFYLSVQ